MAFRLTGTFLRNMLTTTSRNQRNCVIRNISSKLMNQSTSSTFALVRHQTALYSTKRTADVKLSEFLKGEIEAEKSLAKQHVAGGKEPTIEGFHIKNDGAEVILTKSHESEKITVKFNVNDSVDEESADDLAAVENKPEESQPVILSRPAFQVEVAKGNQRLVFECEFSSPYDDYEHHEGEEHEEQDLFNIVMVYLCEGEFSEKVYGASGSILDGDLYDHLMEYLAERGIDDHFGDELIKYATRFEHSQYVNMLQKLRDFASR